MDDSTPSSPQQQTHQKITLPPSFTDALQPFERLLAPQYTHINKPFVQWLTRFNAQNLNAVEQKTIDLLYQIAPLALQDQFHLKKTPFSYQRIYKRWMISYQGIHAFGPQLWEVQTLSSNPQDLNEAYFQGLTQLISLFFQHTALWMIEHPTLWQHHLAWSSLESGIQTKIMHILKLGVFTSTYLCKPIEN